MKMQKRKSLEIRVPACQDKTKKKYNIAIKRRINHEPVAYIVGKKEFWSENFIVNKSTIPLN